MTRSYKTVIVEGVIGSGKTVFSRELSKALGLNTKCFTEPDEKSGNPYLARYYEDRYRWALTMQVHLLQCRFKMHKFAQDYVCAGLGDAVLDRSYYGDVAFAELQARCNYMSKDEYTTYRELYHEMTQFILYPNVCVYLDVSIDTAMGRIKRRMLEQTGRACEVRIERDYMQKLQDALVVVVNALERFGTKIIRLNWDIDRATEQERSDGIKYIAEQIMHHETMREFADIYKRTV